MGVDVCVSVCLSVLGVGGGGCGRCIDMGVYARVREMAGYVCSNDAVLSVSCFSLPDLQGVCPPQCWLRVEGACPHQGQGHC